MRALKVVWGCSEGSVLVEAAVLTPMLFSLVFGVVEFSFYLYQQQLIETGVRDAARSRSGMCRKIAAEHFLSPSPNWH